ncbi:MAG: ABC transporter permease [Holophaga sp.]|jgi:peptide/nickel transport system permease protein/dipeptide transport system permease protein
MPTSIPGSAIEAPAPNGAVPLPDLSPLQEQWLQFRKSKSALFGLLIIVAFFLLALLAPALAPDDPLRQHLELSLTRPLHGGYLLGSDDLGRDILSRILFGSRISLVVGAISVSISLAAGGVVGLVAGYFGGALDLAVMRGIDLMMAFPSILLAIVICAAMGPSLQNAMIAIGVIGIPSIARVIRASVLAEKELDYVTAERSLGASHLRLIFSAILPNCVAPLIVQSTLAYAGAIISAASLSFLGLGAQPPTPEWGAMVFSGKEYISTAWWVITFPGLAILLSVLGFNLLGDGLRDVLDPRMKE